MSVFSMNIKKARHIVSMNPVGLKKFTGTPHQLHRSSFSLKPTVLTMKIGDTPHTAWIAADKKCGKIVSAYCTCVGG